jgi:HEAT repeat protein
VRDVTREARRRCLRAIQVLGRLRDPAAAQTLGDLASEPETRLRLAAVSALGHIPGAETVTALDGFLDDCDAQIRLLTVKSLVGKGALAAPVLVRTLGDESAPVRAAAIRVLRALGDEATPALRALICNPARVRSGWRARLRAVRLARRLLAQRLLAPLLRLPNWLRRRVSNRCLEY